MADLSGKVAVVTGASCGVGRGIVKTLEEAGATVYVCDPGPIRVDRGGEAVAALLQQVAHEHSRLDILVNHVDTLPDPPAGEGVRGYNLASVYGVPLMVAHQTGLIVNVALPAGTGLTTGHGVGGLGADRMAREMAAEFKDDLISALSIHPDRTHTPLFVGRCVAALAMDPDILEKSGGRYQVADLAAEYRFTDPGIN